MAQPLEDAYITLLMSDSYLPGALVLANSLRDAGTTKKLAVLVTMDTLSEDTVTELKTVYDYLIPVQRIRSSNASNLYLMGRPDLAYTFTKIALWSLTQFRKLVYLDADTVALRALDELFDIEASFAAAPDIGWPDAFNTGVMVIKPDMETYAALQSMATAGDSFDGADQGLLNQYFENRPWQRLKFTYNVTPNAEYQWEPAYRHYKHDIAVVHFIGKNKPWSSQTSGGSGVYGELLGHWRAVHQKHSGQEAGQHKYSAFGVIWDATKNSPPTQSGPEAANFPTQTYEFSDDASLYKAPQYPDSQPKPIFPWEQKADKPKATRVFAEDMPSEPTPATGDGNAWDSVPGIDNYVRAVSDLNGKREERPSLPVTPAPVRRPMFWGEERNEAGELPSATGVPDQTEWNPEEKLDELRRSSLKEFEHLKKDEHPDPPLRALPEHSVAGGNKASTPIVADKGVAAAT